jgi:hypothetical protein
MLDEDLWEGLRLAQSALVRVGRDYELPADRALVPAMRQRLERRFQALTVWLVAANEKEIRDQVTTMMATMVLKPGSSTDIKIILKLYVKDLQGLPAFALAQACDDFRQGRAGNGVFMPTQGELRKLAVEYMQPVAAEHTSIANVMAAKTLAPPVSPEARARMIAGFKGLLGGLTTQGVREDAPLSTGQK